MPTKTKPEPVVFHSKYCKPDTHPEYGSLRALEFATYASENGVSAEQASGWLFAHQIFQTAKVGRIKARDRSPVEELMRLSQSGHRSFPEVVEKALRPEILQVVQLADWLSTSTEWAELDKAVAPIFDRWATKVAEQEQSRLDAEAEAQELIDRIQKRRADLENDDSFLKMKTRLESLKSTIKGACFYDLRHQ